MENNNDKKNPVWAGRFNDYHKEYYINNIKGVKKQCFCGLWHDKFRTQQHLKTLKHIKQLKILENLEK
jgi:hypothetical protein